ncbi:MAG: gluconolactonase [Rhodobacteraceae bacterium]|nr:MAG: gluconolactonase [Paracoccaceae bacterium]
MTGGRSIEGTITHRAQARFVSLSDARALHGESPVWSFAHQAIWWVDIAGRKLLRTTLAGQTEFWDTPEIPGFVQCLSDDVMVGMQSGIFRFDLSTSQFKRTVHLDAPGQRFNDACTDAMGRIWAGTMDIDNQRANGVLYLYDPTRRTLTSKIEGFRTVNGLAWDDTRNRLFVSDSHPSVQTVWTCEIGPDGEMGPCRDFARFHNLQGRPDGAALDRAGHYWIAGVGGGSLYRFSPCGTQVSCFSVPLNSPTKPAFTDAKDAAMVLTSFKDDTDGGRLSIWRTPPRDLD